MAVGYIHSTESFGSLDGPGIRFLVFVQGCRMRCRYCHNPDTWSINTNNPKTADELLDSAEKYRAYWGEKGGITVSGGEPLLQLEFLIELFSKAKQRGMNTCLDTAGEPFSREEMFLSRFRELMRFTDLVLFDIKHIDPRKHHSLTSRPNGNILDCLGFLSEISKPVWIRYVLVPGLTDDEDDLRQTGEFIQTLANVEKIEVLPYHTLGRYKYAELGITYTLDGVKPPTEEEVKRAEALLRSPFEVAL